MKRTFAKRSLISLVAGFFLFGLLMLSANRTDAQTYNWKPAGEAQSTLMTEVSNLHGVLKGQTPGTPAYLNTLTHVYYYKAIYNRLNNGMDVPNAVRNGLEIFVSNVVKADVVDAVSDVTVTAQQKTSLFDEAAALLQQ